MRTPRDPVEEVRSYRNAALYRPLARTLRVYNRRLVAALHARGFDDFAQSFPQILSNLDTAGTRIGVLAARAGISRQAAGQLIGDIERCGYVRRRPASDDARATVVEFTPRGRRLLTAVFSIVDETEARFAKILGAAEFEQMRRSLVRLADAIDPEGMFGTVDEAS